MGGCVVGGGGGGGGEKRLIAGKPRLIFRHASVAEWLLCPICNEGGKIERKVKDVGRLEEEGRGCGRPTIGSFLGNAG